MTMRPGPQVRILGCAHCLVAYRVAIEGLTQIQKGWLAAGLSRIGILAREAAAQPVRRLAAEVFTEGTPCPQEELGGA